jgi:Zn finger protein HypA/HybF involved in hydrogenase expression
MCYNRRAVESTLKQEHVSDRSESVDAQEHSAMVRQEHASLYCPVCSQRLESRHCRLICPVCGYYMSCADYY